ncbi:MAG: hypothetical protein PHQ52_02135 [Candidatus Omnitrophica bacterium]|jgi:hypothetical protein|nr:hypothetical protein [Candidatus Omnitrophota bacterium]
MNQIIKELKHHMPFTAVGAVAGIIFMIIFRNISYEKAQELFFVFHPLHVLLSALVTTSLFKLHTCPKGEGKMCNLPILIAIGFIGSVGIATLSDSIIPYLGEALLNMPHRHEHIGIVEHGWLISGSAIIGITIAYFNPSTKFPHAGHVLISTWASLFHVLMAKGANMPFWMYFAIFIFLFVSVWLPCCISDIVFPMMFVKNNKIKDER